MIRSSCKAKSLCGGTKIHKPVDVLGLSLTRRQTRSETRLLPFKLNTFYGDYYDILDRLRKCTMTEMRAVTALHIDADDGPRFYGLWQLRGQFLGCELDIRLIERYT